MPPVTSEYVKFASTQMLRGAVAYLRSHPRANVLLKQAKTNLDRLRDQMETRVIAEHEFTRMLHECLSA